MSAPCQVRLLGCARTWYALSRLWRALHKQMFTKVAVSVVPHIHVRHDFVISTLGLMEVVVLCLSVQYGL